MKKLLVLMIAFASQSYAYTLNLAEQSTFANKKCTLELGNKSYQRGRLQGEPNLMLQEARLTVGKELYDFFIEEAEHKENQIDFGQLPNQTFPTAVFIQKINVNKLSLKAIAKSWSGMTDVRFDCGVIAQK